MAAYRDRIVEVVGRGHDPRHVEAYMRLESGTLDCLSPAQFRREARMAVRCIDAAGTNQAELLAQSFGMVAR